MEKVMAIKNLKKIYGVHGPNPKVAINDISLQIDQGDFVCIMGPSGSGKTTLVNILSTIDEATSGKVILLGQDISNLSEKDKASLRKSEIGFIFQNYNLIETLKNKDNILFSLRLNNVSLDKQQQALIKISKKLGIEDIIDKFLASLPTSHRQVFVLRYWYFMSVKEIMKCCNMSKSKVETILFRTRKKLRVKLEERRYL